MEGLISVPSIWYAFLALPIAAGVVAAVTPGVIALARWRGWVARPSGDRWHRKTTVLMGGIGIYAGAAAAVLLLAGWKLSPAFAGAASLMFLAGLADDRLKLSPPIKVVLQLAAAALFISGGHFFDLGVPRWLAVPVTLFWLLGVTNAVNLIDNMDGLAGGVGGIAALALGAMALVAGAGALAAAAFAVAGAAFGFLLYNFKPARIFMGDCGSLFLGFTLAALAVMVQEALEVRGLLALFMTAMILGVPVLDTTFVTVVRTQHGRPVSVGGRDHTSHRLVSYGLSETQAVLLLYGIAAALALLAVVFYLADVRLRISMLIYLVLGGGLLGARLAAANVYAGDAASASQGPAPVLVRLSRFLRALFGSRWKRAVAVVVDVSTLVAAFVLAHFLRFEDGLTPAREAFLIRSLPLAVVVRLLLFSLFGLYRSIWRFAGAREILRIVVSVTAGSFAVYACLGALYGFRAVSLGVLVIDWMAVVLGVTMTRFGFRVLGTYLTALSGSGTPVAVYGAGDDGFITLRCIRRYASELGMRPVAFIDESERGRILQGLPVVGGLDRLAMLKEKYHVEEVIVPGNDLDAETRQTVEAACAETGLGCRVLSMTWEPAGKGTR